MIVLPLMLAGAYPLGTEPETDCDEAEDGFNPAKTDRAVVP
jgi:hypothetical protein